MTYDFKVQMNFGIPTTFALGKPMRPSSRCPTWALALVLALATQATASELDQWQREFPETDFTRHSVALDEIVSDGPIRDSIPPIDEPSFVSAASVRDIGPLEPVISLAINGDARAYPVRILLWHEIVNDTVGGVPVMVTYCPLCNSAVVFDRRLDGRVLAFGNTGRIRHFDMVMYDRATESWWQQFVGEAIVGELTGRRLESIPARIESLSRFRQRNPVGRVLRPADAAARPYGSTPFAGYDDWRGPTHLAQPLPEGLEPMARVIVVGERAFSLELLRTAGRIAEDDLVITWERGQNSIHDTQVIAFGRDVGNVVVRRKTANGLTDAVYDVVFAFAYRAFFPDRPFRTR